MNEVKLEIKVRTTIFSNFFDHIILFIVCFVLFFSALGKKDLWNPDEPRYAQVAREMSERNDPFLPHFNEKIYPDKPPLFFWALNFFSQITGELNSFSSRLPSAISGFLITLIVYILAKFMFDRMTGIISALVFATSFLTIILSRKCSMDAILTLFTTCAIGLYIYSWSQKKFSQKLALAIIFSFFCGLAVLTKGPIGIIIPVGVVVIHYIYFHRIQGIKKNFIKNLILFLCVLLIAIGVVSVWLIPAVERGGENYSSQIFGVQIWERYTKAFSHDQPWYYYLYNFPWAFLPWFVFFPFAIYFLLKEGMSVKKKEILLLIIWFLFVFLFFTSSKSKREIYLFPMFPACAVIVGKFIADVFNEVVKKFKQAIFYITSALWCIIYIGFGTVLLFGAERLIIQESQKIDYDLGALLSILKTVGLFSIFFGSLTAIIIALREIYWLFCSIICTMCIFAVILYSYAFPEINFVKSAKEFSKIISDKVSRGSLYSIDDAHEGILFYTGYKIKEIKDLSVFKNFQGCSFYIVGEKEDFQELERRYIIKDDYIIQRPIGSRIFQLRKLEIKSLR